MPNWKQLGPFGALLGASAALPLLGSGLLLVLVPRLEPLLREGGGAAALAVIVGVALLCGMALLNTQAAALFLGYLYGFWAGLGLVFCGIVLAAWLGYVLARRLSGRGLEQAIQSRAKLAAVFALLAHDPRHAWTTTALLRISPLVPFASVNVVLAAARVRFRAFLLGTCLGVIPRTVLVVLTGAELASFDPDAPLDQRWRIGLILVSSVLLFVWIGWMTRRALHRRIPVGG